MDDELKKKIKEQYMKDRSKWSDKNIYDEFKRLGSPSYDEELIEKFAPIDESDYSDYSIKRKYTPEEENKLRELADERYARMEAADDLLKQRGYEKYRKKRQYGFGPSSYGFKNPITGKVLRSLGLVGSVLGSLGAPDIAEAAADIVVPGGVGGLGASEEQKDLDRAYFKKLRDKLK